MPGFFESMERYNEARTIAKRLANGCRECEDALFPMARRSVWLEEYSDRRYDGILAEHDQHAAARRTQQTPLLAKPTRRSRATVARSVSRCR